MVVLLLKFVLSCGCGVSCEEMVSTSPVESDILIAIDCVQMELYVDESAAESVYQFRNV